VSSSYRVHRSGFTLAELLIVIFIIGLISTIIMLRFRAPTFESTPQAFSQNVLRFMHAVQEQAILQPGILGIKFREDNYQVYYLGYENDQRAWVALTEKNDFWRARAVPSSITISLQSNGPETGLSSFVELNRPDILFFPSGEVTPFELRLTKSDKSRAYVIRGDESGNLEVLRL